MEGLVALVLVLTFLFGGMMLALVMGFRDIEDRREQEAARASKGARAVNGMMVPGFFAPPDRAYAAGPGIAFDEALLSRLEQHVRAEHERVAEFVHLPSMDRLYRKSNSPLHVH